MRDRAAARWLPQRVQSDRCARAPQEGYENAYGAVLTARAHRAPVGGFTLTTMRSRVSADSVLTPGPTALAPCVLSQLGCQVRHRLRHGRLCGHFRAERVNFAVTVSAGMLSVIFETWTEPCSHSYRTTSAASRPASPAESKFCAERSACCRQPVEHGRQRLLRGNALLSPIEDKYCSKSYCSSRFCQRWEKAAWRIARESHNAEPPQGRSLYVGRNPSSR